MTTVLDIQALQAAAGVRISLAENVRVRSGSVTCEAVQGFSDVRAVELVVRVPVLRGHPAPSVSVTVEKSVNGSDWTTGHAFTFTATGDDSFTLDAPDDYLRVVCAPAGGLREAVVSVVASIVTVDAPGGVGGGSQPFGTVQLRTSLDFADPSLSGPVLAPSLISGGRIAVTLPPSPFGDNGVVKVRVFNPGADDFVVGGELVVCRVDGLVYLAQDGVPQTVPAGGLLDMEFRNLNVSAGAGLSWSSENLQIDIASAGVYSAYVAISTSFA